MKLKWWWSLVVSFILGIVACWQIETLESVGLGILAILNSFIPSVWVLFIRPHTTGELPKYFRFVGLLATLVFMLGLLAFLLVFGG
jgi:hypothetical protein